MKNWQLIISIKFNIFINKIFFRINSKKILFIVGVKIKNNK